MSLVFLQFSSTLLARKRAVAAIFWRSSCQIYRISTGISRRHLKTHVMVYSMLLLYHAPAHKESVEEHARYPERNLRQVKHDACLIDEVDALRPA